MWLITLLSKSKASILPFFKWLKSVYSESDGSGSSTRVHMAALIAFILGVGVSFSVSVHHKYVTIEQFDAFLSAGATFLVSTCGALYGINKVSSWAEGKTAAAVAVNEPDPTAPSPPVLPPQ
jgi:hypothetical protein